MNLLNFFARALRMAMPNLSLILAMLLPAAADCRVLFSPYKDASISMNWNTSVMSSTVTGTLMPLVETLPPGVETVTWAFATGECGSENWGGMAAADLAAANVPLFVAAGVNYVISTGGAAGAFTCSSREGMKTFINRYASSGLIGFDFDIEAGQSTAAIENLVQQIAAVQGDYPELRFSFTIATLGSSDGEVRNRPYGDLNTTGYAVIQAVRKAGIRRYTINLMVMDYGPASASLCVLAQGRCDMGKTAVQAARNLKTKFGIPYTRIELTPMIGMNDVTDEIFSLRDANTLIDGAKRYRLAGLHFWSFDRDTPCALPYASATCSSMTNVPALAYTQRFVRRVGRHMPDPPKLRSSQIELTKGAQRGPDTPSWASYLRPTYTAFS